MTMLDKYIDEVEFNANKESIKTTLRSLYLEACEV